MGGERAPTCPAAILRRLGVLEDLPIPPARLLLNNRKVLEGFYRGLGVEEIANVLRIVDKIDRVGADAIKNILLDSGYADANQADLIVRLANVQGYDASIVDDVRRLGPEHPLLDNGLEELSFILDYLSDVPEGGVVADLHIARGFDYYTGTVVEGMFVDYPLFGSICSGGRYDHLASMGNIDVNLPGMGVSIGISRILALLFKRERLVATRSTPSVVLIALISEDKRHFSYEIAKQLRLRSIPCEVYHKPDRYGKQIRYAAKKGIPFVWFPEGKSTGMQEVRDIRIGEQVVADPTIWTPDKSDMQIGVTLVGDTNGTNE